MVAQFHWLLCHPTDRDGGYWTGSRVVSVPASAHVSNLTDDNFAAGLTTTSTST